MNSTQLIIWSGMSERQRDAWVARHIFKYKPMTDVHDRIWWQANLWETPWGTVIMRDSPDGIPHYSTSLDAIWPAIEEMRKVVMKSRLTDQQMVTRYQRLTAAISGTPLYTLNSMQAARALCELLLDIYGIEVAP